MRLPEPPERYSVNHERERNRQLEAEDAKNVKVTGSATRFAITNGSEDLAFDADASSTAELADVLYTLIRALHRGDRIVLD